MAEKEYRGTKRKIEVTYDDPDGHRYLYVKKTLYSLSDDDWEDLTDLFDRANYSNVSNPLAQQIYHGIIYDVAIQMATSMVTDTEYRKAIVSSLRSKYNMMQDILEDSPNMSFQEKYQFRNAVNGLARCIPVIESCFAEPVNAEEPENVVFNVANVLYLINDQYFTFFENNGYEEIE